MANRLPTQPHWMAVNPSDLLNARTGHRNEYAIQVGDGRKRVKLERGLGSLLQSTTEILRSSRLRYKTSVESRGVDTTIFVSGLFECTAFDHSVPVHRWPTKGLLRQNRFASVVQPPMTLMTADTRSQRAKK